VAESVDNYGKYLPTRCEVVFGGVKINPQIRRLEHGVDVLVATPGRLLDLHQQGAVKFGDLEILVLDEADRMLDMGFIHDIRKILSLLPKDRQTLLFSATFAREIRTLTASILRNPVEVEVAARNATADKVEQYLYPVDKKRKPALLCELVEDGNWQQVLVFARTKHGANRLAQQLEKSGIQAAAIHGNKSQGARTRALAGFKKGNIRVLVATDIAARGLDIDQLPQVVNFDLPNVPEDYVHRIGRTGRAGASGRAYSLVSADEIKQLNGIEQLIGRHIERDYVGGFEPEHELPPSAPLRRRGSPGRKSAGNNSKGGQRKGNNTSSNRGGEGHDRPRRGRRRPRAGSASRNRAG
jgi:ATP-dependent RNA helicase RhlE